MPTPDRPGCVDRPLLLASHKFPPRSNSAGIVHFLFPGHFYQFQESTARCGCCAAGGRSSERGIVSVRAPYPLRWCGSDQPIQHHRRPGSFGSTRWPWIGTGVVVGACATRPAGVARAVWNLPSSAPATSYPGQIGRLSVMYFPFSTSCLEAFWAIVYFTERKQCLCPLEGPPAF